MIHQAYHRVYLTVYFVVTFKILSAFSHCTMHIDGCMLFRMIMYVLIGFLGFKPTKHRPNIHMSNSPLSPSIGLWTAKKNEYNMLMTSLAMLLGFSGCNGSVLFTCKFILIIWFDNNIISDNWKYRALYTRRDGNEYILFDTQRHVIENGMDEWMTEWMMSNRIWKNEAKKLYYVGWIAGWMWFVYCSCRSIWPFG